MKHNFTIQIPAGQQRERLDLYLTRHVENATRNKVQQAIRSGEVRVNGAIVKVSYTVAPLDFIEVLLASPPPPDVLPEQIPLDIVYDDEALLVVNKPAGMVTHPAYKHYSGTLVNALLHYCDSLSKSHPMRPGIVHRLITTWSWPQGHYFWQRKSGRRSKRVILDKLTLHRFTAPGNRA